jgi:hypothetical protein
MKKILDIQNLTLLIFTIVLTVVAVFNSFMFVGLIEEGACRFFETLTRENFLLGQDASNVFPYNLRYFPSIFEVFSVGFAINYLEILNIKYLLYIFTFVSYFKFIIFLVIVYLNIPRNKKDVFEIILLSLLLTFTFTSYQIWAENLMTGLFIWVLFVIFHYVDFDKLTVFNKFCIVIFSFILISSHQMVLIFIPFLFAMAVKKHKSSQRLKMSSEIVLWISYIFLITAIIFNILAICGIYNMQFGSPYAGQLQKYMSIRLVFEDTSFVLTGLFIMIIFVLSFFKKDKKYNKIKYFITITLAFYILYLLLLKIPTEGKFPNITFGFHMLLLFFILIICIGFLKIKIGYKYIRIINLTLCLVIYLNSINYGLFWKHYLTNINQYIINNKKITVGFSEKRVWLYPILSKGREDETEKIFPVEYRTSHANYILYILIFMPYLFDKYKFNDFILINTPKEYIDDVVWQVTINFKDRLKKFGIDVDSYIKINKF